MEKKFDITKRSIIFNFSAAYVKNETEVLSSEAFNCILNKYIDHVKDIDNTNLLEVINLVNDPVKVLTNLFKLLISFEIDEIKTVNPEFDKVLSRRFL